MATNAIPIIDSHIHLYPATHLSGLNWTADLPKDHILNQQSSVEEYKSASAQQTNLLGFVFLETDRKSGLDESEWKDPLEEVEFLARIAQGKPVAGEGHVSADSKLVLGIVPWAPVPAGPDALSTYNSQVRQACGDDRTASLVKGYRYLVQDKPKGTMLQSGFISGLQWLGKQDLIFDLGVDSRSGGMWQLQEACEMLKKVYEGGSELKVVINHFCKPNLRLTPEDCMDNHPDFIEWKECVQTLARFSSTFMKLSGFFSELPAQNESRPASVQDLLQRIMPWVEVVISVFGPSRIMFGSDWPVCSAGGPGIKSWQHWHDLVSLLLDELRLSDEDKLQIWSGTAKRAYNIQMS